MVRRVQSRKKKNSSWGKIKTYLVNSQTMPLVFVFSVIGILFVLIRMKGIEQDYKLNILSEKIKSHTLKNKELKAIRAKELSVKRLKAFAKKFDLKEPDDKRIIVVP